jgi:hypothetical protein
MNFAMSASLRRGLGDSLSTLTVNRPKEGRQSANDFLLVLIMPGVVLGFRLAAHATSFGKKHFALLGGATDKEKTAMQIRWLKLKSSAGIGGGRFMKTRCAVLLFILAGFAIVAGQKAVAAEGDGEPRGIPLPSGQFSDTAQGSQALCFNPTQPVLEDCSTSGVVVVPINLLENGAGSIDSAGNSCFTVTDADSALPVNAIHPLVQLLHSVGKVVSYDSTTGTGDSSFIAYSGGRCHGATFDHAGATKNASGTNHFVVTAGGSRVDLVTTSVNTPSNAVASFSTSGTLLMQTKGDLPEQ